MTKTADEIMAMDTFIKEIAIQATLLQVDDSISKDMFGRRLLATKETVDELIETINSAVPQNSKDFPVLAKHALWLAKKLTEVK